ncbi:hypothetical protein AVEN_105281-1 [Araneus ventricosus]|uniref:Uncharacterized protein n=1 Tax=Araneus ventricosus TaxID=182803 RepID=A0A4Y2PT90_ARAVE|nr:hypothetical protein AVEN_105281-1 [Araneus ventricosus]
MTEHLNRVVWAFLTPVPFWHSGTLKDRRCNSSNETGVLLAIAGHGPTPPEGATYSHLREVTLYPPLLHPQEKRDTAYLSGGFSSTPRGK